MKAFCDNWLAIYYGMMTKLTHISKRNLIQLERADMLPEECYITNKMIDTINGKLKK